MKQLQIRTKDPVVNADPFAKDDYHITAELRQFDIVNQIYQVVYYKNVPFTPTDVNGNPLPVEYNLERVHYFPSLFMQEDEINAVLGMMGIDLNANGTFIQNIQNAMHDAFIMKVGTDGRYGLDSTKWEKVINGAPESQLNTFSIASPTEGESIIEGNDVIISADVRHPYNVTQIEFYEGTTLLGTQLYDPENPNAYTQFTWTGATVGSYALTAKLFANDTEIVSDVVNITIDEAPVEEAPVEEAPVE
jgi:hypothetical protein